VAERGGILAIPLAASFLPHFPMDQEDLRSERPVHAWFTLFRQRAFGCVTLVAALILGSHAMYDSFAVIRWRDAGISSRCGNRSSVRRHGESRTGGSRSRG
jgi:hypothetical protein